VLYVEVEAEDGDVFLLLWNVEDGDDTGGEKALPAPCCNRAVAAISAYDVKAILLKR